MPLALLWLLLAGCGAPPEGGEVRRPAAEPLPPYAEVLAGIATTREALGTRYAAAPPSARPAIVAAARVTVEQAIVDDLFPEWAGTRWAFSGTTVAPREGAIACGYYVSTILRQAGFDVDRVRLAQQPAERIILTLVPRDAVRRFSDASASEVLSEVRSEGDGLYLLGLDFHVAFLVNRGGHVRMCHSSYVAGAVLCEDATTSPAMTSRYRVLGKLLGDEMMEAWLTGTALPTVTR